MNNISIWIHSKNYALIREWLASYMRFTFRSMPHFNINLDQILSANEFRKWNSLLRLTSYLIVQETQSLVCFGCEQFLCCLFLFYFLQFSLHSVTVSRDGTFCTRISFCRHRFILRLQNHCQAILVEY